MSDPRNLRPEKDRRPAPPHRNQIRVTMGVMARLERLVEPMVRERRGDELRPATWDEALDRAAAGFKEVVAARGPQAFGLFSCSKSTNEMNFAAQKFARTVIGSNNIDSCNRT
jgi:predicted molibdopterin-dependent oxidoreductase YjgC